MKTYIKEYKNLGDLLFIENGDIVLGVPINLGIRISYLSYKGSENLFFEQPCEMTEELSTEEGWRVYGGHRLWLAPESDLSYYPDNNPINYEIFEDKIVLSQSTDPWLNVKKEIEISFNNDNEVILNHKVTNESCETKKFAPWSITSMAGNGVQYIPLRDVQEKEVFQPKYHLSMWHYTNLGDKRIEYLENGLKITHGKGKSEFKIGVGHPDKYVSYTNKGVVFEKVLNVDINAIYPDGNVSYETYMCDHMIELETLSPLKTVAPNETVYHTETWRLRKE